MLIGVATPGDLIRDPGRTPFNIGQRVDVGDFKFEEALPLAAGLGATAAEGEQVLHWVLDWTGGHPYLTQRLCRAITDEMSHKPNRPPWREADIERVVAATFLGERSEQDNNLQFVRDMLTKRAPDLTAVLTTYRAVRRSRPPVRDEELSIVKTHLKLAGVVKRSQARLQIRNQIYRTVFDERWIKEHLPVIWTKRLQRLALGAIIVLFIGLLILAPYALIQSISANENAANANKYLATAQSGQQTSDSLRQQAVTAQATSEARRQQAETAQADAMLAEQTSEVRRQQAVTAQAQSERLRLLTQAQALVLRGRVAADPEFGILTILKAAQIAHDAQLPEVNGQIASALRQALAAFPVQGILRGHTGPLNNVAFSPDGKMAVTTSDDKTTRVWDVATAKTLATLPGTGVTIVKTIFSPNNQLVLTDDQDGTTSGLAR